MLQDSPKIRGNKYISIGVRENDGSHIQVTCPIDQINTAVGTFQDYLEKMINSAKYDSIDCILKQ